MPGDGRAQNAAAAAAALAELYARVDAEIAERKPRCEMSGRCCDFPTSEHRLYSTDLESAQALAVAGGTAPAAPSGSCPWYVDGLCRNREGRPLGCRVYFCDPAWEPEMPGVYERYHAELQALHERLGREYRYRPFVEAVRDEELTR
jgi:Fe-S-cluster containining protein